MSKSQVSAFIKNAIREDVGEDDHTSNACIPVKAKGSARLLVKETGIIAGVALAGQIAKEIDFGLELVPLIKDGTRVNPGDIVFTLHGPARSILKAERLILNCMQRMSGIATKTDKLVKLCKGTDAKVIDTRKTTPGMRFLEKWAVTLGGGTNNRFGLYDMILIKDNHIDYAGSISKAIASANLYKKKNPRLRKLKIEIEARNLNEVNQILSVGNNAGRTTGRTTTRIDRIMLDNFSIPDLKKAVHEIAGKYETEASGGITEKNIRSYADCGVDFISVGALTHSVKSLDLSLKAYKSGK